MFRLLAMSVVFAAGLLCFEAQARDSRHWGPPKGAKLKEAKSKPRVWQHIRGVTTNKDTSKWTPKEGAVKTKARKSAKKVRKTARKVVRKSKGTALGKSAKKSKTKLTKKSAKKPLKTPVPAPAVDAIDSELAVDDSSGVSGWVWPLLGAAMLACGGLVFLQYRKRAASAGAEPEAVTREATMFDPATDGDPFVEENGEKNGEELRGPQPSFPEAELTA